MDRDRVPVAVIAGVAWPRSCNGRGTGLLVSSVSSIHPGWTIGFAIR